MNWLQQYDSEHAIDVLAKELAGRDVLHSFKTPWSHEERFEQLAKHLWQWLETSWFAANQNNLAIVLEADDPLTHQGIVNSASGQFYEHLRLQAFWHTRRGRWENQASNTQVSFMRDMLNMLGAIVFMINALTENKVSSLTQGSQEVRSLQQTFSTLR